jgi:hypothetical protein
VIGSLGRSEDDLIILLNVLEGAEERVAMTGDHHISRSTRQGGGGEVPDRLAEDVIAIAFQYHYRYTNLGYFHSSN